VTEPVRTWTVRAVLQWTTGYLKEKGIDSPRLDAEILLAYALDLRRLDLYLDPDRPLTPAERERFKALVRERANRRSVAHITGTRDFFNIRLATPPGVFVPRPETELLVEEALARLPEGQPLRLLDLCTGSGAVALSLLVERPEAEAEAVDLSPEAVRTATGNGQRLEVDQRLTVHQADAARFLDTPRGPYHMITCNPPYIPTGELEHLAPEVAVHEPREALDGGDDGLDLVRALLPGILRCLVPGGWTLFEYDGPHQTAALMALMTDVGFEEIAVYRDLAGHDRIIAGRAPAAA
jgi:release factor glutamine methyltransferase